MYITLTFTLHNYNYIYIYILTDKKNSLPTNLIEHLKRGLHM